MVDLRDFDPEQDLSAVPADVRQLMRQWGKEDTYYLGHNILGYDKMTVPTHGPMCVFLDTCNYTRRLIQHPRSTFKSTVVTVTHRIKNVINNPSVRILIVGDTDTNASRHLGKIKLQFERNRLLKWLYPECFWGDVSEAPTWSQKTLYLPNNAPHGEPTFDTIGAGGGVVSRHFDIINADDLIGEKEAYSPTEMDRVIEWFTGLESLFVPPIELGQLDIPSTYWRRDDVYSFAETFYGRGEEPVPAGPYSYVRGDIAVFRRGAIENGESIFPEGISLDFLHRLNAENPERYAAQYANNPLSSALTFFKKEYRRFWNYRSEDGRFICVPSDTTNPDSPLETIDTEKLTKYSFCDPHAGGSQQRRFKSARAAVVTTAVDPEKSRIFILDTWIKRAPTNEIVDEILRQNLKWMPELFSIESNGFQRMLKFWIDERVERDYLLPVPYHPYIPKGDKDGDQRIRGLQPLWRAGHIYHHHSMVELEQEMLAWPRGLKDGLDALAQGIDFWDMGWTAVENDAAEYTRALRKHRSTATGY